MSLYTNCWKVSQLLILLYQITPFHVAAERGRCEEILGYLLQKCQNINIEDDEGVSYPISQYSTEG